MCEDFYTLDRLTRELGVVFVVSTGNLSGRPARRSAGAVPRLLTGGSGALGDPATALNAVTVGPARHEATRDQQQRPELIEDRPIARTGHPSHKVWPDRQRCHQA